MGGNQRRSQVADLAKGVDTPVNPAVAKPPTKLTRTIKFEARFPSMRDVDRMALYTKLFGMSRDLRRTSNQLISALWFLHLGRLPQPEKDGKSVSIETLASQAFNGKWQPFGRPLYVPSEGVPRAAAGTCVATAREVLTRFETDKKDIARGEKAMATFKQEVLHFRAQEVTVCENGSFDLTMFSMDQEEGAKRKRLPRVTIRPFKLDPSLNEIIRRIQSGRYKAGGAKLLWKKREGHTGKWFFSLSWTEADAAAFQAENTTPAQAEEPLVAGVDLGIQHAAWVSFTKMDGSHVKRPEVVQFPDRTIRAVARLEHERRVRGAFNAYDLGLRSGRGISRKIRSTASIGDKVSRMNDTMVRQMASAVVAAVKQRGATIMVLEDHKDWSVEGMHWRADQLAHTEAAKYRASYFRWHQGAMREVLTATGMREGLTVVTIDPAWTSKTCHRCDLIWKRDWIRHPFDSAKDVAFDPKQPGVGTHFGRVEHRGFRCSCGYVGHADDNAAINIARLGIRALGGEIAPAIAKVGNRKASTPAKIK